MYTWCVNKDINPKLFFVCYNFDDAFFFSNMLHCEKLKKHKDL